MSVPLAPLRKLAWEPVSCVSVEAVATSPGIPLSPRRGIAPECLYVWGVQGPSGPKSCP